MDSLGIEMAKSAVAYTVDEALAMAGGVQDILLLYAPAYAIVAMEPEAVLFIMLMS